MSTKKFAFVQVGNLFVSSYDNLSSISSKLMVSYTDEFLKSHMFSVDDADKLAFAINGKAIHVSIEVND